MQVISLLVFNCCPSSFFCMATIRNREKKIWTFIFLLHTTEEVNHLFWISFHILYSLPFFLSLLSNLFYVVIEKKAKRQQCFVNWNGRDLSCYLFESVCTKWFSSKDLCRNVSQIDLTLKVTVQVTTKKKKKERKCIFSYNYII